jgi:HEAT repeat protein
MMKNAESLPVIVAACSAPDAATRLVALSALSAFRTPETLALVGRAVQDRDEGVRAAALGLLAKWPGSEATRFLVEALRDDSLRKPVSAALGMPAPGRIAGLLGALQTTDDELAPVLVSALGRVDVHDAEHALLHALRSPNVPSRKAAAAMLAARGTRDALDALGRARTEDPSDEVRRVCALFLAQ